MSKKDKVIELLTKALEDAVDNTKIQLRGGFSDPALVPQLTELCDRVGYGNVMATVSALWRNKPYGEDGGFLYGPCRGTAVRFMKLAEPALKAAKKLKKNPK